MLMFTSALHAMEETKPQSSPQDPSIDCSDNMVIVLRWTGPETRTREVTGTDHAWGICTGTAKDPEDQWISTMFPLKDYAKVSQMIAQRYPNAPYTMGLTFKALQQNALHLTCTIAHKENSTEQEQQEIVYPLRGEDFSDHARLSLRDTNRNRLLLSTKNLDY